VMSFIADVETQFLSSSSKEKKITMTPSSSTFHLPLEVLLSQGGDDRLVLDRNMMNKYLSSTMPRPDVLRRGSCTCSTITNEVSSRHNGVFSSSLPLIFNGKGPYSQS
jgi:hypothetical protein